MSGSCWYIYNIELKLVELRKWFCGRPKGTLMFISQGECYTHKSSMTCPTFLYSPRAIYRNPPPTGGFSETNIFTCHYVFIMQIWVSGRIPVVGVACRSLNLHKSNLVSTSLFTYTKATYFFNSIFSFSYVCLDAN